MVAAKGSVESGEPGAGSSDSLPLVSPGSVSQDRLEIGGEGSAMVVIPAGRYRMGCLSNDVQCCSARTTISGLSPPDGRKRGGRRRGPGGWAAAVGARRGTAPSRGVLLLVEEHRVKEICELVGVSVCRSRRCTGTSRKCREAVEEVRWQRLGQVWRTKANLVSARLNSSKGRVAGRVGRTTRWDHARRLRARWYSQSRSQRVD